MRVSPASYTITDEGVILRIQHSTGPRTVLMTEGEAKRLAWAILNDLDPDTVYGEQCAKRGREWASRQQWKLDPDSLKPSNLKPRYYRPTESDYMEYRKMREAGLSLDRIAQAAGITLTKFHRLYNDRFGDDDQ